MNELHPPTARESASGSIAQTAQADPVTDLADGLPSRAEIEFSPNSAIPAAPHQLRQTSIRIYSHSSLLFWWPVWVIGYVMAGLTWWHGQPESIGSSGQVMAWVHPSNNPGVIYFLSLFLIIMITNFSVRGLASGIVILTAALVTVVLAYFGRWDEVFRWLGNLTIHLSLGAYFWFSTLIFVTWIFTVIGIDRLSYWEVTPGQITHKMLFGSGSNSYNAQGMALEKHRDDIFRHWLLGFGSGDLKIQTSGATHEQIDLLNVLFIGSKVDDIQRLIAEVPEGPENP